MKQPSLTILARLSGYLAAAPPSALAASSCTFHVTSEDLEKRKIPLTQTQLEALYLMRALLRKIAVRLLPHCSLVWVASDLSESLWPLLWNSSLLFNQWLWKTYCIRWGLFSIGWSLITTILHWPKGYSGSLKGLGLTSTIWRAHTHTHTHTLCVSQLWDDVTQSSVACAPTLLSS